MFKNCKNSKKQGDIGLGVAISHFSCLGYTVLIPLTDSQDYDLAFDDGEKINKVQVKTTSFKDSGENYAITNLSVKGGNKSHYTTKVFDKNSVDYLFILTERNEKYLIPTESLNNKHQITLNEDRRQYLV